MTMLSQPPPDASHPPPSQAALRSRRPWKLIVTIGLLSIAGLALILPKFVRQRDGKAYDEIQAINNARQLGIAMGEFESEYGSYPAASTVAAVRAATLTTLDLGTITSNDYFRQLIGSGIAQSEAMFSAKNASSHRPDGIFTGTHALEKGECGFTYFLGASSKTDNPKRPLVATPMIPGTDRFDPKPFDGKAVFLKLDTSATSYPIDKDGHVIIDGRNVMDPHHPIWDGHPPAIAWPE